MLESLVGPDGVASEELISDVKALCSLGVEDLSEMAKVFAEFGESVISDQTDALRRIESNVKAFQKDRKLLKSALPASGFILHRWASRNLTRKQIVDDLAGIGISEQQKANIALLLDAMEQHVGSIRSSLLEQHALSLGVARIKSATYACDMRAVFETNKYEEVQGDNQPYFVLKRFVPVAVLEILSELNEKTTTHSFLLDEKQLKDLLNILERARKRMENARMALEKSTNLEGREK